MTELASSLKLAPGTSLLPVSWYLDERILALEKEHLFVPGPGYVGHELMVPAPGDYHTLEWADHGKMLVRNDTGVELLTNVCRHRQAIIVEGRGNARNLVCPLHRWTYDMHGTLLGAPQFAENPCRNLFRTPLRSWNGLLFTGSRDVAADLSGAGMEREFDLTSGYVFDRVIVNECRQNWKTFIEVYLELYHVVPFHPGLAGFVSCSEFRWLFGERYSVQVLGTRDHLSRPGTPVYGKWHEQVRRYHGERDPEHGAIWMLYYPNVMLEWYPNTIVISTLVPRSPGRTLNVVEFYYREDLALFERDYVEAQQAAYLETAAEDEIIGQRTDRGRQSLREAGMDDFGPIQSPMEDGILYFHDYVRKHLEPHLQTAA
ncbi:MAG: aromatic ring-hydroxylating dioxygenase subunit alpha [Betaproteobacteria bacterium]|nr:aromatic ring-hydroxylating dioxygenase subunit alpha [Betaproteobacteria bacterium]